MNSNDRLQILIESIKSAYGSLEKPTYFFMEKQYKLLLRHPFVFDVMTRYFIKNDTDLNDHASFHLRVLHDNGSMMVCLSFVDNWAMVFRLKSPDPIYEKVIESSSSAIFPAEKEILDLLDLHKFRLVHKAEAVSPLDIELFNTDRTEARVYHAIISDDGIIPMVLFDEK